MHLAHNEWDIAKKNIWNLATTKYKMSCRNLTFPNFVDTDIITKSKIHLFDKALSVIYFLLFVLKAILGLNTGISYVYLTKFRPCMALESSLCTLLFSTHHILVSYEVSRGQSSLRGMKAVLILTWEWVPLSPSCLFPGRVMIPSASQTVEQQKNGKLNMHWDGLRSWKTQHPSSISNTAEN